MCYDKLNYDDDVKFCYINGLYNLNAKYNDICI